MKQSSASTAELEYDGALLNRVMHDVIRNATRQPLTGIFRFLFLSYFFFYFRAAFCLDLYLYCVHILDFLEPKFYPYASY